MSGTTDPEAEKAQTRGAACADHGANKPTLQGRGQRALWLLIMEVESLVNSLASGSRSLVSAASVSALCFLLLPLPLTTSCSPLPEKTRYPWGWGTFCRWPSLSVHGYWESAECTLSLKIPFRLKKQRVSKTLCPSVLSQHEEQGFFLFLTPFYVICIEQAQTRAKIRQFPVS